MKNILIAIIDIIEQMSVVDMITLIALIAFIILILTIIYLYRLYTYDMEIEDNEENDMLDLKAISKQLEEAPREVNIELTPYEQEQEQKAIISYDELIKSCNSVKLNYQEEENKEGVSVRQVDLKNMAIPASDSHDTDVKLFNYDQEEAFLEALKNLKNMLS